MGALTTIYASAYGAAFAQWIERAATHRGCSYAQALADPEVAARADAEAAAVAGEAMAQFARQLSRLKEG